MFGSYILDVAFGLVFVYLLLSLICSTINEQVIVRFLSLRAKKLEDGIKNMFEGQNSLTGQVYADPFVQGLSEPKRSGERRKPSYIPASIFAQAVVDSPAVKEYKNSVQAQEIDPAAQISPIPSGLAILIKKAGGDRQKELIAIEHWYDSTMDRVTGWYKRYVQLIILILAFVIVVGLNVDTIAIITNLSNDTAIRAGLVSAVQGSAASATHADLGTLQKAFEQIQPVIGWSSLPNSLSSWILKIVGLLATTFAVSLGAPFWFDLLNKFISFRSTGELTSRSASTLVPMSDTQVLTSTNTAVLSPDLPVQTSTDTTVSSSNSQ